MPNILVNESLLETFYERAALCHVKATPSYLECSICHNTLRNPVCCDSGLHTFCKRCLTQWRDSASPARCPIDRELLLASAEGLRKAPLALEECISALLVRCSLGCSWQGALGQWKAHLRSDCNRTRVHRSLQELLEAADRYTSQNDRDVEVTESGPSSSNPLVASARVVEIPDMESINRVISDIQADFLDRFQTLQRQIEALQAANTDRIGAQDSRLPSISSTSYPASLPITNSNAQARQPSSPTSTSSSIISDGSSEHLGLEYLYFVNRNDSLTARHLASRGRTSSNVGDSDTEFDFPLRSFPSLSVFPSVENVPDAANRTASAAASRGNTRGSRDGRGRGRGRGRGGPPQNSDSGARGTSRGRGRGTRGGR